MKINISAAEVDVNSLFYFAGTDSSWLLGLVPGLGFGDVRRRGWRGPSTSCCHSVRGRHGKMGKETEIWGPWLGRCWVRVSSRSPLAASIQDLRPRSSGGVKSVGRNQLMSVCFPAGLCTAGGQQKPVMGLALGLGWSMEMKVGWGWVFQ